MAEQQKNKFLAFLLNNKQSLYDVLLHENAVGEENLESEFNIITGKKGEQQLKSKLLEDCSEFITNLMEYVSEINDTSIPLYSGRCSFESYNNEFMLHVFSIGEFYLSMASEGWNGSQIKFHNDEVLCLKYCSKILSDHISIIDVELSNYKQNIKHYNDSKSNGYGLSIDMELNFPLNDYLFEKGIISKKTFLKINSTLEQLEYLA